MFALRDRRPKDYPTSIGLIIDSLTLTHNPIQMQTVPKSRMSTGLSEAIAILVDKAGDLNTRLADAATEMLLQLVRLGVASSSLGSPLLAPFKPGTAARSALGRMRLVEAVLPELGVAINSSGNGLACERLAAFLAPAFTHAAGEVRTAAVGLAIQVV